MTNPRVIQQTPEYNIIEAEYKGTIQTFRQWLNGLLRLNLIMILPSLMALRVLPTC